LAIFSWRKSESNEQKPGTVAGAAGVGGIAGGVSGGDAAGAASPPASGAAMEFSPAKAEKFFSHARAMYDASNYEYAVQLWLSGLRFDPNNLSGFEGLFSAIDRFVADSAGKKPISKDVIKSVSGRGDVDRFLLSLLEWGMKPREAVFAVRAAEGASKLALKAPALWITDRAFGITLQEKKVRKDLLIKCSECFEKIEAYEKALAAREQALALDRTDGDLAAKIRSLAAMATMNKGGYDKAGQAGGFRSNIRDADKQRQLEEQERIVKTDETIDRLIETAKADYDRRSDDLPAIERYAKILLERARPADEERAHELYFNAFTKFAQFRFRELAGDIRIRQSRRKASELRHMLEKAPGNETIERMLAQADEEHAALELAEHIERVKNYPTDLPRRFELGKRYFAVGKFSESIEQFQEAQHDPRNRASSMTMLGQAFHKIGWNEEAIETFRHASELKDLLPDTQMEIRYFLMTALQAKSEQDGDLPSAEEADRLASMIARQQMGYRDVRIRRDAIKALLSRLKGPRGA